MRRIVLVVPEWLGDPGSESLLRGRLPTLERLSERGRLVRLRESSEASSTPEAAWLGMDPLKVQLAQGPLTVAAFGADPPFRSVHFHLSLMSLDEQEQAHPIPFDIPDHQLRAVLEQAERLNTRSLTLVRGEQADHGLVWEEGSLDLGVATPLDVAGKPLTGHLPEGDGERILRRYIDDSVNLLGELVFNEERVDQGLPPLNLLWPWGPGFREVVPNLSLLRGEPAWVESSSLRLQGLARLASYRHGDRASFGRGLSTRLERILDAVERHSLTFAVIGAISRFRQQNQLEEAEFFSREIDQRLLNPLMERSELEPLSLAVVAPRASGDGLALIFDSRRPEESVVPFDERALEDRRIPSLETWKVVEQAATRA
jgi:2,3-bisphosphoglycerate-independent phosphoglycerate mutase